MSYKLSSLEYETCCQSAIIFDDYITGDSICTLCGTVLHREHSLNISLDVMMTTSMIGVINQRVYRIVDDMELEPPMEWYEGVMFILDSMQRKITSIHICGALVTLLRERGMTEAKLMSYANQQFGISATTILKKFDETSASTATSTLTSTANAVLLDKNELYMAVINKLGGVISMDFGMKSNLRKQCVLAIDKNPILQFKLPASVVVAVLFVLDYHLLDQDVDLNVVCSHMDIKPITVKKLMILI
jgi:hypothetical protein